MKLRQVEMKDLGGGWEYKSLIALIAGAPELTPQGRAPLNYTEVQRRGDIIDDALASNGHLLLTPERHALLLRLAHSFDWAQLCQNQILVKAAKDNITLFMSDLGLAPEVEPKV